MAALIVQALAKFIERFVVLIIGLIVLLGVGLFLIEWLPADPLQQYIITFGNTIRPYIGLLDYFVPVSYCFYSLSFAVAFKYVVRPLAMAVKQMSGINFNLGSYDMGKDV